MGSRYLIYLLGIVILLAVAGYVIRSTRISPIHSYEECVAAGNIVLDTYPGQCRTKNGQSFTQEIGNELELKDEILISSPRPTQFVTSPLTIKGKIRGTWLFEAQTFAELLSEDNKVLATGVIKAEGEWMTEDFVPFSGQLTFQIPASSKGWLIIEKANPSGMKEKDKALRVSVRFH